MALSNATGRGISYPASSDSVEFTEDLREIAVTADTAIGEAIAGVDARHGVTVVSTTGFDANTVDVTGTHFIYAQAGPLNLPELSSGVLRTVYGNAPTGVQTFLRYDGERSLWQRYRGGYGVWSAWKRLDAGAVESPASPPPESSTGFRTIPLALSVGGSNATTDNETATFRVPVAYGAPIGRWRLHITQISPRFGTAPVASGKLTGIRFLEWDGQSPTSASEIVSLASEIDFAASGGEWVSSWMPTTPIDPANHYFVEYRVSGQTGLPLNPGGAYRSSTGTGGWSTTPSIPCHLWIEAEVSTETPVIAAFGDSLSSGVGATLPVHDSWLSQYCRTHGALPVHYTASGDTMEGWSDPAKYKWRVWETLSRPDAVIHAMGSNDVFNGVSLDVMKSRRATTMGLLASRVSRNIYSGTILPRDSVNGATEDIRRAYNSWLASLPDAARDVFDFVPAISGNDETISPGFNADGIHLNTAGYAALAGTITRPLASTAPAPVVIDARPWMTGPHNWTSATKIAVSGSRSVTMTINARADTETAIPAGTVIGSIPAEYRPLVDVYAQGQNISSEGMRFMPNGDISCPSVNAGAYFKVSATWTR